METLNSNFTEDELESVISELKSHSTPKPDKITCGMLKNLPEVGKMALLKFLNTS